MLVLSRKAGESVTLTTPAGEEITITCIKIAHNQTRLGIEAPDDVLILRSELDSQSTLTDNPG